MTLPTETTEPETTPRPSRQGQGGGPKTSFGKEAASGNATTHGLGARKRIPTWYRDGVAEELAHLVPRYRPQDDDDDRLVNLAALCAVQHRHAIEDANRFILDRAERAQLFWGIDQRAEAVLLGDRLARKPAVVAAQLLKTLAGAQWLWERWQHLKLSLLTGWGEEQVSLAYDLMGIDGEVRQTDPLGIRDGSTEARRALADGQCARLEALTTGKYVDHDRRQQDIAAHGENTADHPTFRRLMNYGHRSLRELERCLKELERRRIARGLPALNRDGSLADVVEAEGIPARPEPVTNAEPRDNRGLKAPERRPSAEPPPCPALESESESDAAPSRRRPTPQEARRLVNEVRLKIEADRRKAKEEKRKQRAERKAAKAARARRR